MTQSLNTHLDFALSTFYHSLFSSQVNYLLCYCSFETFFLFCFCRIVEQQNYFLVQHVKKLNYKFLHCQCYKQPAARGAGLGCMGGVHLFHHLPLDKNRLSDYAGLPVLNKYQHYFILRPHALDRFSRGGSSFQVFPELP